MKLFLAALFLSSCSQSGSNDSATIPTAEDIGGNAALPYIVVWTPGDIGALGHSSLASMGLEDEGLRAGIQGVPCSPFAKDGVLGLADYDESTGAFHLVAETPGFPPPDDTQVSIEGTFVKDGNITMSGTYSIRRNGSVCSAGETTWTKVLPQVATTWRRALLFENGKLRGEVVVTVRQ